mgnify:CR=1 FL=1
MRDNIQMKKKTRSILNELNNVVHERDRKHVIESRGENIIKSAIHLIEEMHKAYNKEFASKLERRLINSIRHRDINRFLRGIKRINEGKC